MDIDDAAVPAAAPEGPAAPAAAPAAPAVPVELSPSDWVKKQCRDVFNEECSWELIKDFTTLVEAGPKKDFMLSRLGEHTTTKWAVQAGRCVVPGNGYGGPETLLLAAKQLGKTVLVLHEEKKQWYSLTDPAETALASPPPQQDVLDTLVVLVRSKQVYIPRFSEQYTQGRGQHDASVRKLQKLHGRVTKLLEARLSEEPKEPTVTFPLPLKHFPCVKSLPRGLTPTELRQNLTWREKVSGVVFQEMHLYDGERYVMSGVGTTLSTLLKAMEPSGSSKALGIAKQELFYKLYELARLVNCRTTANPLTYESMSQLGTFHAELPPSAGVAQQNDDGVFIGVHAALLLLYASTTLYDHRDEAQNLGDGFFRVLCILNKHLRTEERNVEPTIAESLKRVAAFARMQSKTDAMRLLLVGYARPFNGDRTPLMGGEVAESTPDTLDALGAFHWVPTLSLKHCVDNNIVKDLVRILKATPDLLKVRVGEFRNVLAYAEAVQMPETVQLIKDTLRDAEPSNLITERAIADTELVDDRLSAILARLSDPLGDRQPVAPPEEEGDALSLVQTYKDVTETLLKHVQREIDDFTPGSRKKVGVLGFDAIKDASARNADVRCVRIGAMIAAAVQKARASDADAALGTLAMFALPENTASITGGFAAMTSLHNGLRLVDQWLSVMEEDEDMRRGFVPPLQTIDALKEGLVSDRKGLHNRRGQNWPPGGYWTTDAGEKPAGVRLSGSWLFQAAVEAAPEAPAASAAAGTSAAPPLVGKPLPFPNPFGVFESEAVTVGDLRNDFESRTMEFVPGLSVDLYTLRLAPEGRVVQRRAYRKGKDKALPSQQGYLQVGRSFGTTYVSLAAAWKARAGGRYHARLKDAVVAYLRPITDMIGKGDYTKLSDPAYEDLEDLCMDLGTHEMLAVAFTRVRPKGLTYLNGYGRVAFGLCATVYLVFSMLAEEEEADYDALWEKMNSTSLWLVDDGDLWTRPLAEAIAVRHGLAAAGRVADELDGRARFKTRLESFRRYAWKTPDLYSAAAKHESAVGRAIKANLM